MTGDAAPSTVASTQRATDDTPPRRLRFNLRELAGAFGDLGTFLPISIALSVSCGLDFGALLLFAGLMNIATGLWFGQPVAVQPMKAIAAVAIAEQLSAGSVAAAGIMVGLVVLVLGLSGWATRLARWVPSVVIRGLQLGVGLKLALAGLRGGIAPEASGPYGWLIMLCLAVVLFTPLLHQRSRHLPMLLLVVAVGFIIAFAQSQPIWQPALPLQFVVISIDDATAAVWSLVPAQLPLTLLNSVLAVCLLSEDLYPGRGIRPASMASSVGLMNLLAVPFGGMPMCHGSGGLAAQHAFGARTGGGVVILGSVKILAALLMGASAAAVLAAFPRTILGVLLIAAGLRLAFQARLTAWRRPTHALTLAALAIGILLGQTLAAVLITTTLWLVFSRQPKNATPA